MKFQMTVRQKDGKPWIEEYGNDAANTHIVDPKYPVLAEPVKTEEQAVAWAAACIERFNATLRPRELPRELVSVKVIDFGEGVPEEDFEDIEDWDPVDEEGMEGDDESDDLE